MSVNMSLTITSPARVDGVEGAEPNVVIPVGEMVEYLGHIVGGMVTVRYNEHEYVIHPATTKELK